MFDFNDEMTDLFGQILGFTLDKRFMGTQEIKNIIARSKKAIEQHETENAITPEIIGI